MMEAYRSRSVALMVLGLALPVASIAQGTVSTFAGPRLPANGSQAERQATCSY